MATQADVRVFANAMANVRTLTVRDATRLFHSLDVSNADAAAKQLVADLPKVVGQYGELAAGVAADWYDDLRVSADAPGTYRAVMADRAPVEAVQANARWAVSPLFGSPGDTLGRIAQIADRMALQPGRDTIALNSSRDPSRPRWARVPVGKTCEFCVMLASRGAVYRSKQSAGDGHRYHGDCNCTPTPIWQGQEYPKGYDPDRLYQSYVDARNAAKSGDPKEILAKMRELGTSPAKTQLTGSFSPKPAPIEKHQLTGSFAPKPAPIVKTQLTGSFAPKVEKHQLTGSFEPKPAAPVIEKHQLTGSFAPKPPPEVATPAVTKPPIKISLKRIAAEAEKPHTQDEERPRRRFTSKTDGKTWASSIWPGPKGHGKDELAALRTYTGSGYRTINQSLRRAKGGEPRSRQQVIAAMDRAIEKSPRVPEPIVTARATTAKQFGLKPTDDLSKLVGKEFTEHGYMSTSVDTKGGIGTNQVLMRVNVPAGHRAVYVSGDARGSGVISTVGGGEAELILARGARFVVTKARRSGKRWFVDVDILDEP